MVGSIAFDSKSFFISVVISGESLVWNLRVFILESFVRGGDFLNGIRYPLIIFKMLTGAFFHLFVWNTRQPALKESFVPLPPLFPPCMCIGVKRFLSAISCFVSFGVGGMGAVVIVPFCISWIAISVLRTLVKSFSAP